MEIITERRFGFSGKEAYINLTDEEIEERPLNLKNATKFLGGMGIQLKILYDLLEPDTDPFSPQNPIIVGAGPLVGTIAPGTSRVIATLKFPETGAIGSGSGSRSFGLMLKQAGYDHMIITGEARKPVYIEILDKDIRIRDAESLWGKNSSKTTQTLRDEYGDCGIIAIGQAGENQGKIAQAVVDNASSLGRGGLGGVMGSKNLKAIIAKGTGSVNVSDPERFREAIDGLFERAEEYPYREDIVRYGVMLNWPNYGRQFGYTKMRTEKTRFEEVDEAVGFEAYKKLDKKTVGCPSCFIADKEIVEVPEGRFEGLKWATPSYLNAAALGSVFGFEDSNEAVKFGEVTDKYGLDQISFSGIVESLITLNEEGVITSDDVGGLPLSRDIDTVLTWAEKTAFREGFGDAVADGWGGLMKELDINLERRLDLIKGRQGVWDPRLSGLGTNEFAQLVYPRGPNAECGGTGLYTLNQPLDKIKRHADRMGMSKEEIERAFDSPFKINIGRLTISSEHWLAIFNSLGICNRHVINRFYHKDVISELYSATTGEELSSSELMKRAERVWNLFKMINFREGFTRQDDEPPKKWFDPITSPDGEKVYMTDYFETKELSREDVEKWLEDYYVERGWDKNKGIPKEKKLAELELENLVPNLKEFGNQ